MRLGAGEVRAGAGKRGAGRKAFLSINDVEMQRSRDLEKKPGKVGRYYVTQTSQVNFYQPDTVRRTKTVQINSN